MTKQHYLDIKSRLRLTVKFALLFYEQISFDQEKLLLNSICWEMPSIRIPEETYLGPLAISL